MANPLDEIVSDPPADDGSIMRNGRIYVTPEGSGGNSLERNVAPAPQQEDLSTLIGRLRDYITAPEGFSAGNPTANRAVNRLLGTGGEERVQTWPERMVRSGFTLPGDVMSGQEPLYTTDPDTGEQTISPRVIERSLDTAGVMVPGALSNKAGAATLGSGPVRQAAAMPKSEAPVFYSALGHAATNAAQDVMSPQQWAGWLKKQPGVKQEELAWTGIEDWLASQPDKSRVTKADVQKYLDEHKVEIKDVTKESDNDALYRNAAVEQAKLEYPELDPQSREFESIVREYIPWAREAAESGDHIAGAPQYEKYQLEGGENYREHLLTLPQKITDPTDATKFLRGELNGDPAKFGFDTPQKIVAEAQRRGFEQSGDPDKYKSSHWDEPNVLAHVRTNDRVTPRDSKGLLPEERQAIDEYRAEYRKLLKPLEDQQAQYYQTWAGDKWLDPNRPPAPNGAEFVQRPEFKELEKRMANYGGLDRLMKLEQHGDTDLVPTLHLEEIQSDWHQQGRKQGYKTGLSTSEQSEINALRTKLNNGTMNGDDAARLGELNNKSDGFGRIPDAPFKTSWPELALKRMIRMAAEEGKDRISWTPGEAQAARYDLSKELKEVRAYRAGDKYAVTATDKNGKTHDMGLRVAADKLPDIVGKELADKIIKQEGNDLHTYSGLDLKVGGEGMKGFYDNMLPKMVEKLGKAHGVKVKKTTTYSPGMEKPEEVWYFDIPPAWRDQALGKGFPLYMHGVPFPLTPVDHDPFKKDKK